MLWWVENVWDIVKHSASVGQKASLTISLSAQDRPQNQEHEPHAGLWPCDLHTTLYNAAAL